MERKENPNEGGLKFRLMAHPVKSFRNVEGHDKTFTKIPERRLD